MSISALDLARVQFGFTITFHIIFPAISIGMAIFLAFLEACWLRTKNHVYLDIYHFWAKFFAVSFGMGVVSGVVMAYQFGTNWSEFSKFAGGITGPLLTYEVITAFFLEAGFLGVMLFGWNRVGPKLHFFATCMVALGTLLSTFWILASNSWMQTPAGVEIIDGVAVPVDWWAVVFNPSFPYRLAHMTTAVMISSGLFVLATAAWHLLKGNRSEPIKAMFRMTLVMLLILTPLQVYIGDLHGLNVRDHQPEKLAAIEGHWDQLEEGKSTPFILFGFPDMEAEKTHYAIEIPYAGSLVLTHSLYGQIPVLKDFDKADRPPSYIVFWTFRIMVGLGILMVVLAVWGAWLRYKGRLFESRPFMWFAFCMGPSGLLTILAGWYTTEIGRQPWTVYGLLRTADAVSNHDATQLTISLTLFVICYFAVFGAGTIYLFRIALKGPKVTNQADINQEKLV